MKRMTQTTVVALLIALILLAFTWKDIALAVIEHSGSRFFRENFQPGKDIHVVISKDDWAIFYFAGTKGLSDLSRLSTDPSLTPKGRELAKDLRSYIESGSHLAYIVELQKDQRLTPVMMNLVSRIKERDQKQATQPGH